jgi:hypothetical protein
MDQFADYLRDQAANIEHSPKRLKNPSASKSLSLWPAFATRPPKTSKINIQADDGTSASLTHLGDGSAHDFAVRVHARTDALACGGTA